MLIVYLNKLRGRRGHDHMVVGQVLCSEPVTQISFDDK
jgi:hypothetical protein